MNEFLTNYGRVIDLSKKSLSHSNLKEIWKDIKHNKRVGHVIWGENALTDTLSVKFVKKIEDKIIQNNKNCLKYPNDFIHALLSSYVYKKIEQGEKVEFKDPHKDDKNKKVKLEIDDKTTYNEYLTNWKVLKVYDKPKAGKYYAASFINESEYQLVLAHRGTPKPILKDLLRPDSALMTDIDGVLRNGVVAQLEQDFVVTKEVVAFAKENGYQLSITGHSLGAWLAEFSVYFCAVDFHFTAKAVTFDSPGSSGVEEFSSSIISLDTEKIACNLDIVTYLSPPNFVNTCNKHLGTAYMVFPKVIIPDSIQKFLSLINASKEIDIEPISSIFSHSLDVIIKTFNPVTGKPKEYKQIKNWPVIEYTPKNPMKSNVLTQFYCSASLNPINMEKSSFRTLLSIIGLVWDVLIGRIDQKQQLECWKYLKQIPKSNLPISFITNPENEFGLKYKGRYEVCEVNLYKDRSDKTFLHYLKALSLHKDYLCEDPLIDRQLEVISIQYNINPDILDITNPNNVIESIGSENLTIEQLNNWLSILVAVNHKLRHKLNSGNRNLNFTQAVADNYKKLSEYANQISPDLVSKSSVDQQKAVTFESVQNAIDTFKNLGAKDNIKKDFIAEKITINTVINCIRTLHSFSNHYMYKLHAGDKARALLQLCKDIAETCIPLKEGLELYFNKLEPDTVYDMLPKSGNQPEEIIIMYIKVIYSFGRTYIYEKPGSREIAVKYFELSEYLGKAYDLLEGHLSVRSGLGVIKGDKIDAFLKKGNLAKAKIECIKIIKIYEELRSNNNSFYDNPFAPQPKIVVPKYDAYNTVECTEQILKYYGKLVSITPNLEEQIKYTQEIKKCTELLFDKLHQVNDKKIASVFNTLGDALLILNDANIESSELKKIMQLVKEKVANESNLNNLEIMYSLFYAANEKSENTDFTKADSANGMMKVLCKQIAASPNDEKSKLIEKFRIERDNTNKQINREVEYEDIALVNNPHKDTLVTCIPENYGKSTKTSQKSCYIM